MVKSKVSVVIVNFNAGELLAQCVRSVLASSVPVEVIVSDNGSTDNSIEMLREVDDKRVTIVSNGENIGFARGVNRVITKAKGKMLLFLNPDCILTTDTLEIIVKEMDKDSEIGMAGCLLCNPDGTEQAGGRRRVPTPARSFVRAFGLDNIMPVLKEKGLLQHEMPLPDDVIEVEAISGAFMLVKREALEDVGLLDEGYFLHCEDLDWCMRFRKAEWKVVFVPHASVTHQQGTCSSSRPVRVEWHKHKGMVRFYRKFFRHQYPLWMMVGVIISVWFRFVAVSIILTGKRWLATHASS